MPYKDKEKQREYQNERNKKARRDWIESQSGACLRCGATDRLEVDHVDPTKKVSHRVWSWSKARRENELEKCQVLCHECHLKKTHNERAIGITHGTNSGYTYFSCRCVLCRKAHTKSNNEWRYSKGLRIRRD